MHMPDTVSGIGLLLLGLQLEAFTISTVQMSSRKVELVYFL